MIEFADYPLSLIFVAGLVVILTASEIGHQFGRRVRGHGGNNVSTLEASILGLLALMISFTFAMALSRFDARRDGVLNEANAIGTTALRARLLPAPQNTESLKLLREYVQVRLDITKRTPSASELDVAIARSNAIQEALWQQAKAVAAKDKAFVPTGLFIQSLNDLIDNQEKRLIAGRNRIPNIVLAVLYALTAIAVGFTGYVGGLESRRWRLPVYLTGIVVAAVILLIQDLDRPSSGFITVSQQAMIDVAASLANYSD
jgi:Protein of unknown function (DUF4239)